MKTVMLVVAAVLMGTLALGTHPDPAKELVDKMHSYYVGQFNSLKMTEKGVFGTSRIESSSIKGHTRDGGDPGYQSQEYSTSVTIFGARGKPMTSTNIEHRYHRSRNGPRSGKGLRAEPKTPFNVNDLAKRAVAAWSKGGTRPIADTDGVSRFEARPIVLSKRECLKCHSGMKLSQPVAVAIYRLTPFVGAKG